MEGGIQTGGLCPISLHNARQTHALLDQLPPLQLAALRSLLEVMVEPRARSLARGEGVAQEGIPSDTMKEVARRFSGSGGSR